MHIYILYMYICIILWYVVLILYYMKSTMLACRMDLLALALDAVVLELPLVAGAVRPGQPAEVILKTTVCLLFLLYRSEGSEHSGPMQPHAGRQQSTAQSERQTGAHSDCLVGWGLAR